MGITIKDIAKKANVAVSTVSKALNNKSDIGIKTRERILKIVEDNNYSPNFIARGLATNKHYTLGLIIPDISNPFFAEVALGIEITAKELGYTVILINTNNKFDYEISAIRLLKSKMVDGLIISLSNKCKHELNLPDYSKLPIIQIDRKINGLNCSGVYIDNEISAYKATKHLLNLGHRKIAHFTGNLKTLTGLDRLKGFKRALKEYNISDHETIIIRGKYSVESGKETMYELLNYSSLPTAIFAASDLQAAGAVYIAQKNGIMIPKDISIMGHDGIELSYLLNPNLTTMNQPKKELGMRAVELLIKKMNNKSTVNDVFLNSELIVRESTSQFCGKTFVTCTN